MSTDVSVHVSQTVTDPETGEIIDRSDTAKVAILADRIREYQRQWKTAADWCRDALIEASDERAEWTFEVGGLKVKVDPPSSADIDWDLSELAKLESILPSERYGELVQQTVIYKAQTGKLQALARQSGVDTLIWKIITAAERRKPKQRRVSVS